MSKSRKRYLNKSMIIGFIGVSIVVMATILEATSKPMIFFNIIGFFIVFGAILTTSLIMQPLSVTISVLKRLTYSIYGMKDSPVNTITELINFSDKRRSGYKLSDIEIEDDILRDAVEMMSIGLNPADVKRCTELRIENLETELSKEAGFLITLSKLAPAFGLVGTLLGMILLIQEMGGENGNMDNVGPAMAIALCATLYGVALANMVFYPWAEYLAHMAHESLLRGQIINEGLAMIYENRHPIQIRETLKSYLNKKEQVELSEKLSLIKQQQTQQSEEAQVA